MVQFNHFFMSAEQLLNIKCHFEEIMHLEANREYLMLKVPINYSNNLLKRALVNIAKDKAVQISLNAEGEIVEKICVKSNTVKKTIRVDDDLLKTLQDEVSFNEDNNEISFNALINDSISREINTLKFYGDKLALLPTKNFPHRITVHFSLEDYNRIQNVVYELKQNGINFVTFSVVVRSILYEALGLVTEYRISHRSPKQLLSVA